MNIFKRWLKFSLTLCILIVLFISVFNYKIDSLGLFGNSTYLSKAAKSIVDGHMVAGLKNYDERLFQGLVIKKLKNRNDIVAIGSSRLMQLRKMHFRDENINFYNNSVSGASLEDFISIVGAYELIQGYIPSTIIFGIDPWVFNKSSGQLRWKTLRKYYTYEVDKILKDESPTTNTLNLNKWKQLFNFDNTVNNVKFVLSKLKNNNKSFYVTNSVKIDDSIKETDGSIHYPYKLRYIDDIDVKNSAVEFSKKNIYSLDNFNSLNNIDLFESFILYLKSKRVEIVIMLSPYHPISFDEINNNPKYKNVLNVGGIPDWEKNGGPMKK